MKTFYIALGFISLIGLTTPVHADDTYVPPNNGHPDGTVGSGTRVVDCTYRGTDRREGCL